MSFSPDGPALYALLALLLLLSGTFSSVETAFFSLTPAQRRAAGPSVQRLLRDPRSLLLTVLLLNLLVNVAYFAFADLLLPDDGGGGDVAVGLAILVVLLCCGEILPKTVGLRARLRVSSLAAPLFTWLVRCVGPVGRPLAALTERLMAFLRPPSAGDRSITTAVLARVMAQGAASGSLLTGEADLLTEVLELDSIRVREIMTPRVDALFLDVSGEDRAEVVAEALERRLTWLPVVDGDPDQVQGHVPVRALLAAPDKPVRQLVMPVKFVPEVASALDLLSELREDRTSEAVVADEWGGTAGIVTAEDVFEELVGDLRHEDEARTPAVVPLGEDRYRVAGSLPIRDWNEAFGRAVVPTEFETLGGFVTALLGRIPRTGDVAHAEDLELAVHEVRGRRVLTVDVGLRSGEEEER